MIRSTSPRVYLNPHVGEFTPSAHISVAIVGAGASCLSTALHLHDRGIECAVFERDDSPSGSTALSSGFIPAPCTRLQRSLGIMDSVDLFVQDLRAKSQGQASKVIENAYASAVGPALDALQVNHGFEWEILDQFLYPGHSVHRMHTLPERTGQALMGRLLSCVERLSIPVLTGSLVTEIWLQNQQVIGIGVMREDDSVERYSCEALVLCCNGYGGNPELISQHIPEMRGAVFAGHKGNDGSALIWGAQMDAQLADLSGYQGHGSWAVPHGVLMTWALMMSGGIQINSLGERFHDETKGYSEAAVEVLNQPGGVVWCVFDERIFTHGSEFPDFRDANQMGAIKKCMSISELAVLIGCSQEALDRTLQGLEVSLLKHSGKDSLTGRIFTNDLKAPFFAVKVTGALFHTQGGLGIDANSRVLSTSGEPFLNLFAAGGAARGVSGNSVWGYLSGNGLLSAFAGAYIAACSIADSLGFKK